MNEPGNHSKKVETAIAQAMQQAAIAYTRGEWSASEQLCRRILKARGDHFDALNLLGIIAAQTRRLEEAAWLLGRAVTANSGQAAAHINLGNALRALHRLDEALASYDQALALKPGDAETLYNRGNTLFSLKRLDEALAAYDKALASRPAYAEALNNRGNLLQEMKRPDQALACYDQALALMPDHPAALYNRGNALRELHRLDEALACYDRALALKPGDAETLYNRGNTLYGLKRFDEALAAYDEALAHRPTYAEALINRGNVLQEVKRFDEALACYDKALALGPNNAGALYNRARVLQEMKRLEEALACYDKVVEFKPAYAEGHNNRGNVLQQMKRLDEALSCYDEALAIRADYADALYNRGLASLLIGDFPAGWAGNESRWDRTGAEERKLAVPLPLWMGGNASNKKIIVYDEQGLGDVIQFARYLRSLVASGAQVTFIVRPCLLGLLRSLDSPIRLLTQYPAGESFDYQSALLSLPLAFGTSLESIPAEVPYLRAQPERVQKWKDRLGEHGFRIGIAWQGSKTFKNDHGRSFALAGFFGVSQLPNVRLISLQKNEGIEQLRDLPEGMKVETLGDDYDAGGDAFADAAAVIQNLDLVISSDTSIAHLAGALGRPVWVALKHVPDWRWLLDRTDSPWYPTMRLFRQRTRDHWRSVFSEIETALLPLLG